MHQAAFFTPRDQRGQHFVGARDQGGALLALLGGFAQRFSQEAVDPAQ